MSTHKVFAMRRSACQGKNTWPGIRVRCTHVYGDHVFSNMEPMLLLQFGINLTNLDDLSVFISRLLARYQSLGNQVTKKGAPSFESH